MSDETARTQKVTVRMYRQGLGDAFLIGFHTEGGDARWMLIDCGATDPEGSTDLLKEVAQDVKETTKDSKHKNGHLRLVVASNLRRDHVSGFAVASSIFKEMDVDEVWLPATEDRENDHARRRESERRKRLAELLAIARALPEPVKDLARSLTGVLSLSPESDDLLLTSESAGLLTILRDWEKKGTRVMYLDTRDASRPIFSDLAGPRAFVLGPREPGSFVATPGSSDLEESFLDAARSSLKFSEELKKGWAELLERNLPFPRSHQVTITRTDEGGKELREFTPSMHAAYFEKHYFAEDERWRQIDHDWLAVARSLTLALDRAANNDSLALAFEISKGGKVLLFPGDAQLAAWKSWGTRKWAVTEDGEKRRVRACDLLSRVSVYKVSHRCSQTGTLIEGGLNLMESSNLVALLPVDREAAELLGWDLPYAPLLQALREKTRGRILISDRSEPQVGDRSKPDNITRTGWSAFQKAVTETPLYIEYELKV